MPPLLKRFGGNPRADVAGPDAAAQRRAVGSGEDLR